MRYRELTTSNEQLIEEKDVVILNVVKNHISVIPSNERNLKILVEVGGDCEQ